MTTNQTTRPVRVPVGSCVAVAPPGAGKSTVLKNLLLEAGLPADRVVNRDDLRLRYAANCARPACRMLPTACTHVESFVDEHVNAAANNHLIAGRTWFYDQTGCDEAGLRAEVERAHQAGVAAVALRRGGPDGDFSLEQCLANNATRHRRMPDATVVRMHADYVNLTEARLYELGFDVVISWDSDTRFQLMPEGPDARHITTALVVVGDLHGCARTFFERMLPAVGFDTELTRDDQLLVGVGDINDKGGAHGANSGAVELIRWWIRMIRTGRALLVDSNHNKSLVRALTRGDVVPRAGLAQTLADIDAQPDAEQLKADIVATFSRLPTHLVFADTVVVHAAMTEDRLFGNDRKTQGFAVHTRYDKNPWEWTGSQTLVHGHEIVSQPSRRRAAADPNRPGHVPGEVVAIDTGAYKGGGMTCYLSATGQTVTVDSDPGELISERDEHLLLAELVELGVAA